MRRIVLLACSIESTVPAGAAIRLQGRQRERMARIGLNIARLLY